MSLASIMFDMQHACKKPLKEGVTVDVFDWTVDRTGMLVGMLY
jgi:hypothetical protein